MIFDLKIIKSKTVSFLLKIVGYSQNIEVISMESKSLRLVLCIETFSNSKIRNY